MAVITKSRNPTRIRTRLNGYFLLIFSCQNFAADLLVKGHGIGTDDSEDDLFREDTGLDRSVQVGHRPDGRFAAKWRMSWFPVSPHFSHDLPNAKRRLLLPGFFDNSLGVSCLLIRTA